MLNKNQRKKLKKQIENELENYLEKFDDVDIDNDTIQDFGCYLQLKYNKDLNVKEFI